MYQFEYLEHDVFTLEIKRRENFNGQAGYIVEYIKDLLDEKYSIRVFPIGENNVIEYFNGNNRIILKYKEIKNV